jgi:hypothetical protein
MAKKGAATKKSFFGKGGGSGTAKAPIHGGMKAGLKSHGGAKTQHQIKPAKAKTHKDRRGVAKMPSAMG